MDVLYLGIGLSLFVLSWLLTELCDSLSTFGKDQKR